MSSCLGYRPKCEYLVIGHHSMSADSQLRQAKWALYSLKQLQLPHKTENLFTELDSCQTASPLPPSPLTSLLLVKP